VAHTAQCAFAGLSLAQIEDGYAARQITGMGYHHLKDHVTRCPMGCRPLRAGEPPPMQRYRRAGRTEPTRNITTSR
jgi:hypothetical protein